MKVTLLHPPLPSVGVLIRAERGCQQCLFQCLFQCLHERGRRQRSNGFAAALFPQSYRVPCPECIMDRSICRQAQEGWHSSCERGCTRDDYGKAGPFSVERLKMDLPFVTVSCVQTSAQRSAGPLTVSPSNLECFVHVVHMDYRPT